MYISIPEPLTAVPPRRRDFHLSRPRGSKTLLLVLPGAYQAVVLEASGAGAPRPGTILSLEQDAILEPLPCGTQVALLQSAAAS
jgi:hypothetical protein